MSLKYYLMLMSAATFFCWVGWLMVVFYINPLEAGMIGFLTFYVSLFLALAGTFSLLGFFLRVWFSREEIIFRHLGVSLRQAILFSILIIVALILLGEEFLSWWNALLLVLFLTIVEVLFQSRGRPSSLA